MNTHAYLKRINFEGVPIIDLSTLKKLHECHLGKVPFENLDIHFKNEIILEIEHLFKKVVENKRGGFCYELNFLFQQLLVHLGFEAKIIAAQIFNEDELGPEYDHMALLVSLNGTNWLADVGFGDLFLKPLPIDSAAKQFDGRNFYKIENLNEDNYLLSMSKTGTDFEKKYTFQTTAKQIEQFEAQCQFKQTAPSSYFVQNKIVTLPISNGRKTIFNTKYTVKTGDTKTASVIENEKVEIRILKKEFYITI